MGSIRKEFTVDVPPDQVWSALRDFGAVHELARGFVTDTQLDDDIRIVTFFSGAVAREQLVDIDDDAYRLVYAIVDSPLGMTHHNASAQVFADGDAGAWFVWTADLLPDELTPTVDELMERGSGAMKEALETDAAVG